MCRGFRPPTEVELAIENGYGERGGSFLRLFSLTSLFVALASTPWAFAQAPVPDSLPAPSTAEATPPADTGKDAAAKPAFTGWDDGFILRSPDKKFSLRITGQIQTDYRGSLTAADQTDFSTFSAPGARY